jgi:hypothetical protein
LKTLTNLSSNGTLPIGRDSQVAGRPSERLVRVAFGLESFQGRAGLYFVVRPGMVLRSDDTVRFGPLIKNKTHIEGGLFTFRGMNLLLFLEPEGPPEPLDGVLLNGEDLGYAQLNFHNREIKASVGKYLSQVIRIDWQQAVVTGLPSWLDSTTVSRLAIRRVARGVGAGWGPVSFRVR